MSKSRVARTTCIHTVELAAVTELGFEDALLLRKANLVDAGADIERKVGSMSDPHVAFLLESRDNGEVHLGCAARMALGQI